MVLRQSRAPKPGTSQQSRPSRKGEQGKGSSTSNNPETNPGRTQDQCQQGNATDGRCLQQPYAGAEDEVPEEFRAETFSRPLSPLSAHSTPAHPLPSTSSSSHTHNRTTDPPTSSSSPTHNHGSDPTVEDVPEHQKLRGAIVKCTFRITRAQHHLDFISHCKTLGIIPKGLSTNKSINIMDGPDRTDCLDRIQEIIVANTLQLMDTLIVYYEDLVQTEQEKLQLLNSKLRTALEDRADQEVPERDFRENLTSREDGLRETLRAKREKKTRSLRDPHTREPSRTTGRTRTKPRRQTPGKRNGPRRSQQPRQNTQDRAPEQRHRAPSTTNESVPQHTTSTTSVPQHTTLTTAFRSHTRPMTRQRQRRPVANPRTPLLPLPSTFPSAMPQPQPFRGMGVGPTAPPLTTRSPLPTPHPAGIIPELMHLMSQIIALGGTHPWS